MGLPTVSEVVDIVCSNPIDKFTWAEWKKSLADEGIIVMDDDSGFSDSEEVSAEAVRIAVGKCTCMSQMTEESILAYPDRGKEIDTVEVIRAGNPEKKLTVGEWRRKFTELTENPPVGEILKTEDGSPVRLEIELHPDQAPFIYTRAYVPKIVGATLGWFAQGKEDTTNFGWKLILLPKARDEVIKRLGIAKSVVYVSSVRVIKPSNTNRSLLGEITEW